LVRVSASGRVSAEFQAFYDLLFAAYTSQQAHNKIFESFGANNQLPKAAAKLAESEVRLNQQHDTEVRRWECRTNNTIDITAKLTGG